MKTIGKRLVMSGRESPRTTSSRGKKKKSETLVALDAFLNDDKTDRISPLIMRRKVLQIVTARRRDAALRKDYEEAAKLIQKERLLQAALHDQLNHHQALKATTTLASSSSQLRERILKTSNKFNAKIQAYLAIRENKISKIIEIHGQEIREFIDRWRDSRTQSQFCKASPTLLQYRSIERRQAALADYEGADATRRLGDALESKEVVDARVRLTEMIRVQFNLLQQKQASELEVFRSFTKQRLRHMQKERDDVIVPMEKAIRKAEEREGRTCDVIRAKSARGRKEREPDFTESVRPSSVLDMYKGIIGEGASKLKVGEIDVEGIVMEEIRGIQRVSSRSELRSERETRNRK
jgi:hypothetical protein